MARFNLSKRGTALTLCGGAVVLAAATIPASASAAPQRTAGSPPGAAAAGWRIVQQISVRHHDVLMVGIVPVSATDAWAVGEVFSASTLTPLVEHWNGNGWTRVVLPPRVRHHFGQNALFDAVSAAPGRSLWAFTLNGRYLHLNGTRWTAGQLPGASDVLVESAKEFGPSDTWVFGARTVGRNHPNPKAAPYAARFNGSTWQVVPVPGHADINAVSAIAPDDIFTATGLLASSFGQPARPRVLHWDGRSWQSAAVQPGLPRHSLAYTIFARSRSDVWLGGSVPNGRKGSAAVVVHWNGTTWQRATPPRAPSGQSAIVGLTTDGHGGLWALGASLYSGSEQIWHYTRGSWSTPVNPRLAVGPLAFGSLAAVPGSTSIWAIGDRKANGHYIGLIVAHGALPH